MSVNNAVARFDFSGSDYSIYKSKLDFSTLSSVSNSGDATWYEPIFSSISSFFPINCPFGNYSMEYVSAEIGLPTKKPDECMRLGISYAADILVKFRLYSFKKDSVSQKKVLINVKEQSMPMLSIPMPTLHGTFIVNGVERVVVSQIHKSPGVMFNVDKNGAKYTYSASVIPYSGTWLDFVMKDNEFLVVVDKRKKLSLLDFLVAINFDLSDLLTFIYQKLRISYTQDLQDFVALHFDVSSLAGSRLPFDIYSADTKLVLINKGELITTRKLSSLLPDKIYAKIEDIIENVYIANLYQSGGKVLDIGSKVDTSTLKDVLITNLEIDIFNFILPEFDSSVLDSFLSKPKDVDLAVQNVSKALRLNIASKSKDEVLGIIRSLFFDVKFCNLSSIGRYKFSTILGNYTESTTLVNEDISRIIKKLIEIKTKSSEVEDIDHLGNRRIRGVWEMVSNVIKLSMSKLSKSVVERMSNISTDIGVSPSDILASSQLSKSVKDFFAMSSLSQFMEQTNPIAEISHKRRISALGPGGVDKDRAGLDIRDVHFTHYGRVCIVETPDSQNIGLISNFATFARLNKFGFIETPYRVVKSGNITDEIIYLDASAEFNYNISSYNKDFIKSKKITSEIVSVRRGGDFIVVDNKSVDLIDVAPNQILSFVSSCIPFFEHNDAYRVLMASNMQRQAVPIIKPESPVVGTGFESVVTQFSSGVILAKTKGTVKYVDSTEIIIQSETGELDIYNIKKFTRTNQSTCINLKPIVSVGQEVEVEDIIADGYATEKNELALGKNLKVAFMSWNGYGYEDSVIVSKAVACDDDFTSIHIEEFSITAVDTRLGPEEITRDIPGVPDAMLKNLDESGIIRMGSYVKPGDILVGKIMPKAETPISPEERLLMAIFDEKIAEKKDASLTLPPGYSGVIVGVEILSRRGVEKLHRQIEIEAERISDIMRKFNNRTDVLKMSIISEISTNFENEKVAKSSAKTVSMTGKLDRNFLQNLDLSSIFTIKLDSPEKNIQLLDIIHRYQRYFEKIKSEMENQIEYIKDQQDFSSGGVLYDIKVKVANRNMIQPGDKIAGRHGNKGIISIVAPVEDMPFMADGTPVDMVINPLGIVARMNFGQVLEIALGLASLGAEKALFQELEKRSEIEYVANLISKIDAVHPNSMSNDARVKSKLVAQSKPIRFAVPPFSGFSCEKVTEVLRSCGVDECGQIWLYDGMTGERFDRKISTGYMYIMKLHHLVDSKIHARSIGPYSLVTQQPLGGKSSFGGQRLGEMECWALQAYGAAYSLHEMLTAKADDIEGRKAMYGGIIKGNVDFKYTVPESFNVLMRELSAIGLNISFKD